MKLTPLDIHHKEFRHALRGYNEEEVDQFLDQVADEFERLFKENIDLSEKLNALQEKVNEFEMQRQTINNTLLTAQRSADDIIGRAQGEADGIVAHANTRAKEIVNDALAKKQQVRGELLRIKQAEEDFRERYRALLENNLRNIEPVGTADDVSALLGESDEPSEAPASAPVAFAGGAIATPEPPVVVEPEPVPVIDQQESLLPEPSISDFFGSDGLGVAAEPVVSSAPLPTGATDVVAPAAPAPEPAITPISIDDLPVPTEFERLDAREPFPTPEGPAPVPATDIPSSGLISAVSLGELESPEIPDDLDLVEPSEFSIPRFDALGEREDDLDIEEID